jgi:hypothetical protein
MNPQLTRKYALQQQNAVSLRQEYLFHAYLRVNRKIKLQLDASEFMLLDDADLGDDDCAEYICKRLTSNGYLCAMSTKRTLFVAWNTFKFDAAIQLCERYRLKVYRPVTEKTSAEAQTPPPSEGEANEIQEGGFVEIQNSTYGERAKLLQYIERAALSAIRR